MNAQRQDLSGRRYRDAMGRLIVLYTQVDRMIMEICAERIVHAPDEAAKLALAKQTGDECRHVTIQRGWMEQFGTDPSPVISAQQEQTIRRHFRDLPWLDFLADLYVCVEALGSEAVERIVPLADPGTRQSLRIPLSDEIDHVAFGISRLKQEVARLEPKQRARYLDRLPGRIDAMARLFAALGLDVERLFQSVGADCEELYERLVQRREEILEELRRAA